MKSVSSSELRAVLPSSAFAKCYDSVKIERERAKCVYGCAINVCTSKYEYQYVSAHSPTHSWSQSFLFFLEVTNNTIANIETIRTPARIFHLAAGSCTYEGILCDERSTDTHHESVSLEHGNFFDFTKRTEKFAKVLFFDTLG